MIDPTRITNFNRSNDSLEELILFCIAVAGKNATVTSKNLDKLLNFGFEQFKGSPFQIIKKLDETYYLEDVLKNFGFGCYKVKSKGFSEIANSNLNLRTCTVLDLESIHGIGMKSARFFILHSRENANVACLDTHVLQWLRSYSGLIVPKQTPARKKYIELETVFLNVCNVLKMHPAKLDLKIWNKSRRSDEKLLVGNLQE